MSNAGKKKLHKSGKSLFYDSNNYKRPAVGFSDDPGETGEMTVVCGVVRRSAAQSISAVANQVIQIEIYPSRNKYGKHKETQQLAELL